MSLGGRFRSENEVLCGGDYSGARGGGGGKALLRLKINCLYA